MSRRSHTPAPQTPIWTAVAVCSGVLACAGAASAQWANPGVSNGSTGLRRVDQGFADRTALSTSLRTFDVDLRTPAGFQTLYQLPAGRGQPGQYVRQSGAISAVFPHSVYVNHKSQTFPAVPAGTVYYIGNLPATLTAPGRAFNDTTPAILSALPTALDARAPSRAVSTQLNTRPQLTASRSTEPAAHADTACVLSDEIYRAQRLAEILDNAMNSR